MWKNIGTSPRKDNVLVSSCIHKYVCIRMYMFIRVYMGAEEKV